MKFWYQWSPAHFKNLEKRSPNFDTKILFFTILIVTNFYLSCARSIFSYFHCFSQDTSSAYCSKLYSELSSCKYSPMIFLLNPTLFPLGFTLLTVATKGRSDLKMCLNGIWIILCQKFGCAMLMIISYFDPFIQSHYSYLGKHFKPSSCSCLLCRKRKTFPFFNQSTGYFFTRESSLRKHRYIFSTSILYKTSLMSYPQISFDLF